MNPVLHVDQVRDFSQMLVSRKPSHPVTFYLGSDGGCQVTLIILRNAMKDSL